MYAACPILLELVTIVLGKIEFFFLLDRSHNEVFFSVHRFETYLIHVLPLFNVIHEILHSYVYIRLLVLLASSRSYRTDRALKMFV